MSQNNNFAGGFFLGALIGGAVGGIVGAAIASRQEEKTDGDPSRLSGDRPLKLDSEESIEIARRRLEDKIAQLNSAIDDVRQQLGNDEELSLHSESSRES
jgi:hypothetical protein